MSLVFTAPRNPGGKIPVRTMLYRVDSEPLFGKTIGELKIRKSTGCTVLSVRRDGAVVNAPDRSFILVENDKLQVCGTNQQLAFFERVFSMSPDLPIPSKSASQQPKLVA